VERDDPERERRAHDREARESKWRDAVEQLHHEHRANERADAEARKDPARDMRIAVVPAERQEGHGDGDRARCAVEEHEGERHRPEQAILRQEAHAREDAAMLVVDR
jgi:hypothetical protein